MTLPPVVRVFFAIELSPVAKNSADSLLGLLKKQSRTSAIRWTRPENLHITLQFLAEVQSKHLPLLIQNVRERIIGQVQPMTLTWGELQFFPSRYRPRVIVLDVAPQVELAALSALIGAGIVQAGYPIEQRAFRAHLTLGRIKQPQHLSLRCLMETEKPDLAPMAVNAVALFRSEPQPEGSIYTIIEKITFDEAIYATRG